MEEEEEKEKKSMRQVWRCRVRAKNSTCGHVLIVVAFLVFTLHVITQRQPQDNTREFSVLRDPLPFPMPPAPLHDNPQANFQLGTHGDWQEAQGSNRDFFLYSAYLDRRGKRSQVVIVAIVKKRKKVTGCRVWTGNTSVEVNAKTKLIHENWNLVYSAALVQCTVPSDSRPTYVSLLSQPTTLIPVQDMEARERQGQMSVCVKPLHYGYDRALWLVEFIELYRLLGADKFIFYNHTMGPNIEAVVKHYMDAGVVTLLPWSLPVITQKEIRTEGIFAALNDCNLRSVHRFPFSAMVDFDEFLIPRKHDSLLDLLASYGDNHSAYVFQNVFFYLYWENDTAVAYETLRREGVTPVEGEGEPYLLTAFKTRRMDTPHKSGIRSKYIVRPERVVELGNHHVWEYVDGKKMIKRVPPDDALSHHYRICEYGGYECLKHPAHVDRAAHAWLTRMYRRVLDNCAQIFPADGACPKAPPLGSPF
ncbi:beta-1,4-galactosyltransferase galt-1-like isoform X3 [Eriocheir sinensis]|uniref:beta-1,4-galactosyltransferase galt-1-like isoform X3 n=1 Tax=Eriocheir sinensis TaxID=95602 RepID=UPI0021CA2BEE|nr:beta-1,4-galactosyltransferase galt-1-like isoform X3 [Eriocheir sinensis]